MAGHNRRWFRNNYDVSDKNSHILLMKYITKYYQLNEEAVDAAKDYLLDRYNEMKNRDVFGIVYDITYLCNLNCLHCGVNAKYVRNADSHIHYEKNFSDVVIILKRIYDYIKTRSIKRYFLIFGRGEPFIRGDMKEILKYASSLFGSKNVGINTNGTICDVVDLNDIKHLVGVVEISLDGFENYNNRWRRTPKTSALKNPFTKTYELIRRSVEIESLKSKIEVSSVITKENLGMLPDFVNLLAQNGVENFSVHRPMPVGRMAQHLNIIPTSKDFLQLLLNIAELRDILKMKDLHIHHSLESIFSVMFLGFDIHQSKNIMSSKRHSIGIDPCGNVYMDSWCVVPPYNILNAGSLLSKDQTLEEIIHSKESIISVADEITKQGHRCIQCKMPCSGGMRFNALANYISNFTRGSQINKISESHLIIGLSKIDPACPLYDPV